MKHVSMNNVIKCKACEYPFISDIAVYVLCKYWFHLKCCNISDDEIHSLLENLSTVCAHCTSNKNQHALMLFNGNRFRHTASSVQVN